MRLIHFQRTIRRFDTYIQLYIQNKDLTHTKFVLRVSVCTHKQKRYLMHACLTIFLFLPLILPLFFFAISVCLCVCVLVAIFPSFNTNRPINRAWVNEWNSPHTYANTHTFMVPNHNHNKPAYDQNITVQHFCIYVYVLCYFAVIYATEIRVRMRSDGVWRMFYYIIDVMVSVQVSPVTRI